MAFIWLVVPRGLVNSEHLYSSVHCLLQVQSNPQKTYLVIIPVSRSCNSTYKWPKSKSCEFVDGYCL